MPLGDFGPAPPGVNLEENQTANIVTLVVIFGAIALCAVILRVVARLGRSGAGLAMDDFMIIVALTFGLATMAMCIISIPFGGGKHLWSLTFPEFNKLWQTTYAFVLVYATAVTCTKTSILLFYRRVFGTNWAYYVCMGLVAAYWVAITIAWLTGCRPVSYFWEQFTVPGAEGHCMNTNLFYFVNGICAMLIDIAILSVPMPIVYHLQMPPKQKLLACGILLLGSFVCIASVVRIVMMDRLVNATDFTWAMAPVFIWSCCEPLVGILCACLPTYAPLVRRWWEVVGTSSGNSSGRNKSRGVNVTYSRYKSDRRWKQLKRDDLKLGPDDEFELTHDISADHGNNTHSAGSDDEINNKAEIRVHSSVQVSSEER